MYTDVELKQKILELDPEAIEYLYQRYKDRVYSVALRFLKSEDAAEDFVQDFFVHFIYGETGKKKGIEGFTPDRASLSTYINVKLNSRLIDRWRKQQRQPDLELTETTGSNSMDEKSLAQARTDTRMENEPHEKLEAEELGSITRTAIGKLDSKCQKVLQLRYYLDLSYKEIAEILDIPVKTVGSRIHKCMRKLRDVLRREFSRLDYEPF